MKMCVIPILLGIGCLLAFGILSSVFGNQLQLLFMALLPLGWMLIFAGIYVGLMYLSQVAINPIRFRQHRH
ncbi:hypothetical protein NT239_08940 [Chitinibacter sp. SCUT-21]|uniref:hypothetical protein n=1 Tax=Chitinibacter sp. SCUT-21 TaxID=2970891 RepID=UPI0035A66592